MIYYASWKVFLNPYETSEQCLEFDIQSSLTAGIGQNTNVLGKLSQFLNAALDTNSVKNGRFFFEKKSYS